MRKKTGPGTHVEMSERQAERVIEEFENGSRNGEEWAHDVCLHRGTPKYETSLLLLNKAFQVKSMKREVLPLPGDGQSALQRRRSRR